MGRKSLFFKFFTALTLLIAIPMIILTVILSYEVMRYSESEISKSYIGKLKVANNFSEMLAEGIYMDALKITMDGFLDDISGVYSKEKLLSSPDGLMVAYELHESIVNLASANDILHSVYLLPEGADFLVTSNQGIFKMDEFSDKEWLDEYYRFIEYKSEPAWMCTRTIPYSEDSSAASNKVITFFYMFTPYTTTAKGTLIFNIHENDLRSLINSNSSINEGYITIVNQEGKVITHIKDELVGQELKEGYLRQIQDSTENEGYFINKVGEERQLITYLKSDFNNWIYIGIFSMDILMGKVNSLMMKTVYIGLFLLLLGILVSFIVSMKVSNPLDKLVQDIRINRGIDIKSSDSEMAILSKAFEHMIKEEVRLFSILENSKNSNRNVYLLNLIQGKSTEGLNSELTGIDFNQECFICAVILIDRYHLFTNRYSNEQQEYMKTLILKVSEQLIGINYKCAGMIYQKQRIVLIINYDKIHEKDIETTLKNIFRKIQEQVIKVLDNTISIGLGNSRLNAAGVSESFERAQEALKYKLITGYGDIHFWKDAGYEEMTYYYPYSREKQLFNLISSGIVDKIDETVNEMIQEIREQGCMHYENVVQIFTQLAVNTVKFLLDQHLNISMIFGSNYNVYSILTRKETMVDIRDWLIEMFTSITEYLTGARNLNKNTFDRALAYIHENYKKDIDINVIAENVGLSYSHLRKVFKDETGENIINYINHIRIDESKRLLCQTGMTIREISSNLGYNNEQSFIRFFKKYENTSPGEYRLSKKLNNGRELAAPD